MKKIGRNDPCACGSGKKYKQCCLKQEELQVTNNSASAIPRAIDWIWHFHGKAAQAALKEDFFGSLDDHAYDHLMDQDSDHFHHQMVMINAMEWLIAEGSLLVRGKPQRVADLLLGKGGPLFSIEQRQWIEALATYPLKLYEIVEVSPGEYFVLKDVLHSDALPTKVLERSGSQGAAKFDLLAARLIPIQGHTELSGAVYSIPRIAGLTLIEELKLETEGLDPDSLEVKEIYSWIIIGHWLDLMTTPMQMPTIVDALTGDPILTIDDYYQVLDWPTFENMLSSQPDIEGDRKEGWHRVFMSNDGLQRASLVINLDKKKDRIKVFYRTQAYADKGRPWFESVAGTSVKFLTRQIIDPEGYVKNQQSNNKAMPARPEIDLPPEVITQVIEQKIHSIYANWVDEPLPALNDQSPREAIKTREGLEQVKFLLNSYQHSEMQQAADQGRTPVSYSFLWNELGISS